MEVTRQDYSQRLPIILKHICEAHFLSFDLELSGIPDQKRNRGQSPKSVAERYVELKQAAETYHILQVGLTCVEEDQEKSAYVIRTFNFNISPLIDEQLDLERAFTYSTGAVDFLLRHDYKMESPFVSGIPYLTRVDTSRAMENALARWDRQAIPDIKIRQDDVKALSFMQRVREEVNNWQKTKSSSQDSLDIVGISDGSNMTTPLNRFEKRLVHQIVRAEYPSLQSFSRTDGVQVQPMNEAEQKKIQQSLRRRLKATISNQVGFRWVAEAMVGGDLSGLDLESLAPDRDGTPSKLRSMLTLAQNKKKVLIGHNCLLDLVYFFHTFYGPLPATLEEFAGMVHDHFSTVVDTKYLSTAPGSTDALRFRNAQLSQIDQAVAELTLPTIQHGSNGTSYGDHEQYHEAGFDSFVTAKVFLRLAMKLADGHPGLWSVARTTSTVASDGQTRTPRAKERQSESPAAPARNSFAHRNMFDGLLSDALDDNVGPVDQERGTSSLELDDSIAKLCIKEHGTLPGLIPHWDSQFWTRFGNKLRVYGTTEEMYSLYTKSSQASDESPLNHEEGQRRRSILDGIKEVVHKLF